MKLRLLLALSICLAIPLSVEAQLTCSGGPMNCPAPQLTPTRVIFVGTAGTLTDSANLYWDASNFRLGIGTATPRMPLDIKVASAGAVTPATAPVVIENSGNTYVQFLTPSTASEVGFLFGDPANAGIGNILYDHTTDTIRMDTGGTTRMSINGSGVTVNGATATGGFNTSGTVYLNNLTAEAGTKAALCNDVVTKEVQVNTGVSTCLVSTLTKKDWVSDITCKEAVMIVQKMRPAVFKDKDGADGPRFGFAAEWTEKADKRLVEYNNGRPVGVDYNRYTAVLTKAIQCRIR